MARVGPKPKRKSTQPGGQESAKKPKKNANESEQMNVGPAPTPTSKPKPPKPSSKSKPPNPSKKTVKQGSENHFKSKSLTRPAIRKMCRQGGVKRINGLIYEAARDLAEVFLEKLLGDAVTRMHGARRKTVKTDDVLDSAKSIGKTLYTGGPEKKRRKKKKED